VSPKYYHVAFGNPREKEAVLPTNLNEVGKSKEKKNNLG